VDLNWLTPRAQARPAGTKGWGSFVVERISRGETVAAFGGHVVPRAVLDTLTEDRQSRSIQIDDDLYLVSGELPEPGDMLNHSCAPSCGVVGSQLIVAMRDIEVGEELTFDYAMCDASDYDEFACACGEPDCRGTVTGRDWQDEYLQRRYAGWFSPYVERRIAAVTVGGE
jgi:SET domain-containing protein